MKTNSTEKIDTERGKYVTVNSERISRYMYINIIIIGCSCYIPKYFN